MAEKECHETRLMEAARPALVQIQLPGDSFPMIDFAPVRCPNCDHIVLDAASGFFTGLVRVLCPNKRCRRRVWVGSNVAGEMRAVFSDKPPPPPT